MSRRVLWVSKETPDRHGQGGQRRQYFQIRSLVRAGHRVEVLTLRGPQDDRSISDLAAVQRVREGHRRPTFRRSRGAVAAALRDTAWDGVVVAHGQSWGLVEPWVAECAAPVLVDLHNVMSRWYRRLGDTSDEAFWWHMEQEILSRVAAVSTCSQQELDSLPPAGTSHRFVLPSGIDAEEWPQLLPAATAPRLVAFGNWWWHPNQRGLEWFCSRVWPGLRSRRPQARVELAGLGVTDVVAESPGLTAVGRVADLARFVAGATAVIVPVVDGAGAPLKFAEAVASGVPVVATVDAGQAAPDAPALVSDDPEEWVETLQEYLADPVRARARGAESRRFALSRLTWDQVSEPLATWVAQADAR